MAESELVIIAAEPEDAEAILEFLNRVGGESDNLLFGAGDIQLTVEQEREWILKQKEDPHSVMLLGKLNGRLAATGSLNGTGRERIAHRAEISVVVARDSWSLGIGRRMMESLIRSGREHPGFEIIELKVRADNERAIRLYESLGFKHDGTCRRFFKINGSYYDALLMSLLL